MMAYRDRMTNVRPGRGAVDPCPTCMGSGALLPLPSGQTLGAQYVVPHRGAWHNHPAGVAPCPPCEGTGWELGRRPRRWGGG